MESLLIHDHTKLQLLALATDPPHALLLVGSRGSGKFTIAKAWAQLLTDAVHIHVLEPDEKGTITIDAVRSLYRSTRARQEAHQVVIIDHCQAMGTEAQNAFLKLLEEPRSGVSFVLTTHTATQLLPTITSRVQTVQVQPVSNVKLGEWLTRQNPELSAKELQQILFVADGRPAVATMLIADAAYFEAHKQIMAKAKYLLSAKTYERLVAVPELSKDRLAAIATLEAMMRIVALQLRQGANKQWINAANALEQCLNVVMQNGNLRTQLTQLFVSY